MKKYILSSSDSDDSWSKYDDQYKNLRFKYEKQIFGKLMNIHENKRQIWFQGVMDALEICDIDTSRLRMLYEVVLLDKSNRFEDM